jgi:glycerol-3-phosphate dehydrogenase
VAAGTYHDARVSHPERLVLELLQDGLRACPASSSLNHATLTGTDGDTIRIRTHDGQEQALRPRMVVNAAGPWIDGVNAALGAPSRLIGGTKGSHVLLDHPGLIQALKGRMIYFEADDGRICLVFDYLGRALVGSTDIRATDPDDVHVEAPEIAYFLQSLRALLPGLTFDDSQIVYAYSGIRPLPASDGTAAGLISRDHSAPVAEPQGARQWPIMSLVGGKWTTFRGFAEEVADSILGRLGMMRRVSTRDLPIGGGRGFPVDRDAWTAEAARLTGADPRRAALLLGRYGTTARAILQAEGVMPQPLTDVQDYTMLELDWLVRNEQVVHLSDLVMRRTALAITRRLTMAALEQAAEVTAAALGWDEARRMNELAATRTLLETRHHMRLAPERRL